MFDVLDLATYCGLIDELDAEETVFVGGVWPVTTGRHPALGEILLAHIGNEAYLVTAPSTEAARAKFASQQGA